MCSIGYIILSCKPFLKTRAKWQRDTWLSKVPQDSYVFLTGAIGSTEPNVICMNDNDSYESCPERYYQYIKETDMSKYDWVVFPDDDTFIFPERLHNLLQELDHTKRMYIGRQAIMELVYIPNRMSIPITRDAYNNLVALNAISPNEGTHLDFVYMSGGAGFVLSRATYTALREYLLSTPKEEIKFHGNGDVTMGLWLKFIDTIEAINCTRLNPHNLDDESSKTDVAISYHYLNEELFMMYGKMLL